MKTLAGTYLKFFTSNQREKERGVWCSREIGFIVHQKRVRNGVSVSFQPKCIPPAPAVSSAQTNVENEEIQTISSDQSKTVHVRFKLYKECAFGQQFLVVGDDPILGLWDPSEGVPLTWSEGHVWTAELDIPIGKVIKYKFILKGNVETILWQPGPDRILETFETEKIISVSDDWDKPELQTVVEEDSVELNEESLVNSHLSMEDVNLNQVLVEEGDNAIKKVDNVDDNISEELDGQNLSSSDEGFGLVSEKQGEMSTLLGLEDETRLVSDEGVPVLVPGLVPTSMDEIEADETKDSAQSELKEEHVSALLHCTEAGEVVVDEKRFNAEETITEFKDEHAPALLQCTETSEMMVEDEQMESDILESDMQWGRRTLQKFLANFGFI